MILYGFYTDFPDVAQSSPAAGHLLRAPLARSLEGWRGEALAVLRWPGVPVGQAGVSVGQMGVPMGQPGVSVGQTGVSGGRTRGCQGRPHLLLPWRREAACGPDEAALARAILFYIGIAKMCGFFKRVG